MAMANYTKKYKEPYKILHQTDADIIGELDRIALNTGRSRTDVINEAINIYLNARKWKIMSK